MEMYDNVFAWKSLVTESVNIKPFFRLLIIVVPTKITLEVDTCQCLGNE